MLKHNMFIALSGLYGAFAVMIGAFGAHALKDSMSVAQLGTYQTGNLYHITHTLALLAIGLVLQHQPQSRYFKASAWLITIGIPLFSGSLYALALGGPSWLGPITPLGGMAFIIAWLCLALGAMQYQSQQQP